MINVDFKCDRCGCTYQKDPTNLKVHDCAYDGVILVGQTVLALHERLRIVENEFNKSVEILDNHTNTLEALVQLVDPEGYARAQEIELALSVADDDS